MPFVTIGSRIASTTVQNGTDDPQLPQVLFVVAQVTGFKEALLSLLTQQLGAISCMKSALFRSARTRR